MESVSLSYKGHRYPAEVIAHCVWLYVLWSRTSHYLTSGSDQVTAVLTGDRLPDTDDPVTALRNLIAGVLPPVPYREDDRWPMDRALHRIEKQAWEDWKAACQELLDKDPVPTA